LLALAPPIAALRRKRRFAPPRTDAARLRASFGLTFLFAAD